MNTENSLIHSWRLHAEGGQRYDSEFALRATEALEPASVLTRIKCRDVEQTTMGYGTYLV